MGVQIIRLEHHILQDARGKLGLTQQQVADAAKVTLRQYQRFENGERSLSSSSFDIARRVLDALMLDLSAYARGDYSLSTEAEGDALLRKYFSRDKEKSLPQTVAFKDKLCVFIGRLECCSKREAQERLFAVGGVPQNNIAAYVSYVITGKGAEDTKSYAEAKRYARSGLLSIITEKEFFDILDGKAMPLEKPKPAPNIIRVEADTSTANDYSLTDLIESKRAAYIASKRFVAATENR
jgi:transcriptional regulator with XRE-family HTH domain